MSDSLLGPLILSSDLILLFWGEIILDVESLSDLLWRFTLDHVCNSLAADIEKSLNIHVVGSLSNSLAKHNLIVMMRCIPV